MVHAFQLLFIDCNYPRAFVWWIGMHAVMFFFLFKEFYNEQYNKPRKMKVWFYIFNKCKILQIVSMQFARIVSTMPLICKSDKKNEMITINN